MLLKVPSVWNDILSSLLLLFHLFHCFTWSYSSVKTFLLSLYCVSIIPISFRYNQKKILCPKVKLTLFYHPGRSHSLQGPGTWAPQEELQSFSLWPSSSRPYNGLNFDFLVSFPFPTWKLASVLESQSDFLESQCIGTWLCLCPTFMPPPPCPWKLMF